MKIVFASTNKGKIREIKELLFPHEVLSLDDIDFHDEIIENGTSFYENARIKAQTIYDKTHMLTLADDSGIEVYALNFEPGIYSARYSKTGNDDDNNELLLKKLEKIEDRRARYVCSLVAIWPEGHETSYYGTLEGLIGFEYRGNNGFGYDPIFVLPEYGKTSAEISMEEKNKISHRGKALKMFYQDFLEYIK